MLRSKQGKYWYHFHNVFGMTRSLTRDWTRDLPHSKPACEVLYDHSSWLLWFNHIEKPFFPARLLWSNDYMNLAGNELPIATALTNSHRGNALLKRLKSTIWLTFFPTEYFTFNILSWLTVKRPSWFHTIRSNSTSCMCLAIMLTNLSFVLDNTYPN